jgi:hypothetical protein
MKRGRMAMINRCDYSKQAIHRLERKLTRPNGETFDLVTFLQDSSERLCALDWKHITKAEV